MFNVYLEREKIDLALCSRFVIRHDRGPDSPADAKPKLP